MGNCHSSVALVGLQAMRLPSWHWFAVAGFFAIAFVIGQWFSEQEKKEKCYILATVLLRGELRAENSGRMDWVLYGEADQHLHGMSESEWMASSAEAYRKGARDMYNRLAEEPRCLTWEEHRDSRESLADMLGIEEDW